jgi:hypothetical protein
MAEFIEIACGDGGPSTPIYDASEQERIISKAMVKDTYGRH